MFEFKPDLEITMQRMEAFWEHSVLDRPVTQFFLEKPRQEQVNLPVDKHSSTRERWLDVEYQTELTLAQLSNRLFLGDSLPVAFPNLGPEVLAAFYGCPIEFGDYGTSWTEPILKDWDQSGQIKLDLQNPYFSRLMELTDAMLVLGRDRFIVGLPDFHPGGDLAAALRNPQELAVDMIDHPEQIKNLLTRLQPDYFKVYDIWYDKFAAIGQPVTSWLELASYGKYYIPSNDFSALVSQKMYSEFFLAGIIAECQFLERSIYHLDGPGALRHLDCLLGIRELDAVQWVPGAGREGFEKWVSVYQKIQAAGKSIIVYCDVSELPLVMQTLKPGGLALSINGMLNSDMAANILSSLKTWCRGFMPR
ncbi:MAG: hypothetical protein WCK35_14685 [Chloroflexota bacterium]